jgi:DNA-binding transcriptional regulator YiaG
MTDSHDCTKHFAEHRATRKRPYHFLDSGLSNVYLIGIKYWICRECKAQAAEIPSPERLMDVIAESIVMKPGLLSGPEVKFLRKRAGKKAADFAQLISKTPEHLSKIETRALPVTEPLGKLVRLTYGLLSGNTGLLANLRSKTEQWLKSIDPEKKPPASIKIQKAHDSWLHTA